MVKAARHNPCPAHPQAEGRGQESRRRIATGSASERRAIRSGPPNVTVQMQPLQSSERSEHSIARLSFATVCYAAGASIGGRRDLAQEPLDVVAVGERRGQAIGWSGHGHKNAVSAMTVGATRDSRGEGRPITIRGATRTSAAKSPSGSESAESAAPVDAPQRGDPRNLDTLQRRSVRAGRCRASGTTTSSGLILASTVVRPRTSLVDHRLQFFHREVGLENPPEAGALDAADQAR